MTIINDSNFLRKVIQTLQDNQISVWIFGGWAEELHGFSASRTHADIDLLYPAANFRQIDSFLQGNDGWHEIIFKRFPHKRAAIFQGIMVEFFLIQKDDQDIFTCFFDRLRFSWPKDTLRYTVSLDGMIVNVSSRTALQKYRMDHATVSDTCRDYLQNN